eukprot:2979761-Amphidinium_carterae.1
MAGLPWFNSLSCRGKLREFVHSGGRKPNHNDLHLGRSSSTSNTAKIQQNPMKMKAQDVIPWETSHE